MAKRQQGSRYVANLKRRIGLVFKSERWLPDHRAELPWLTGFLGNPTAPIWFVAENPSLGTGMRAGLSNDANRMWNVSPGDKLFRRMLSESGFKDGNAEDEGGWGCYITDVVKSAHDAGSWARARATFGRRAAIAWAPVLRWELAQGQPRLIVAVGEAAANCLRQLNQSGHLPVLPPVMRITHYSARRGLARLRYPHEFKMVRQRLEQLLAADESPRLG